MQDILDPQDTNSSVDKAIGSLIAVTLIVGILGNVSAFIYFWPNRHRGTPNKLYIAIVSVDTFTSLLTIPVMISLLNNREPMLFAISSLCGGWTIGSTFLVRMSMFLVAVMSVTRTIAIVLPFKHVKLSSIIMVITVYATQLLAIDGAFFASGWIKGSYYPTLRSYCSYAPTEKIPPWTSKFVFGTFQIEVMLPSIVVFISFIASLVSLMRNRNTAAAASEKASRKVSVTITLFTAVFLVCNIPLFLFQLLHMVLYFDPSLKAKISTEMTKKYGHLMFLYVPYILNAALNPLVYLLRMPRYKEQFLQWSRTFGRRVSVMLISLRLRGSEDTTKLSGEEEWKTGSHEQLTEYEDEEHNRQITLDTL